MFGRESELTGVEQVLDQVALGAAGVALEGAPGIGKTTLWSEAVHSARRRGYKVISTVPSAPDRALVFAGLGDLFDGLDDELIDGLPDLPRRALRGALLLDDVSDSAVDASAVPRASLTVIRRLAEQGPLVVAIDDEQWLDPASARALAFALCRLREERVGVLLARVARPTTRSYGPSFVMGLPGADWRPGLSSRWTSRQFTPCWSSSWDDRCRVR